jgi:hypothetical protein
LIRLPFTPLSDRLPQSFNLPGPLLHLRGSSRLTTDAMGFEDSGPPCSPLYPCAPSVILSLPPSLCLEKGRGAEKGETEEKRKYEEIPGSHLKGVAFPSSLRHGRAGLDSFHRYARPPAKTHESWVYGDGGARGLSCARGPYVPHTCGGIHGVLCGILSAGTQHATTPVPLLASAVLRPRASPLHSLRVLHIMTFVTLCEAYQGIDSELDLWKYFFHVRRPQDGGSGQRVHPVGTSQPLVHLTHLVGGGCGKRVQNHGHRGHVLAGPGEGGELLLRPFHCRGPVYLKCRFTLAQVGQPASVASHSYASSPHRHAVSHSLLSCGARRRSSW